MARAFSRAIPRTIPSNSVADFYNPASDTHFAMSVQGGKYYQRRWQIGFDGKETNAVEAQVDFVMGSGNHARTYLHRTQRGTLIELPLGWYAEKGGYWGMNPGYDTVHPPSNRPIGHECMFCHNAYPQIAKSHETAGSDPLFGVDLPEGIDCQRCHGPGAAHTAAAQSAAPNPKSIRASIVNPARLGNDRQMEVCFQCHLETASTRLPSLIRRFTAGPFSYLPGQPLGDFVLSFDHEPGREFDDKFEIAGGAYRLRQSKCFLQSKGRMTCLTCHDPHSVPRGAKATARYTGVCLQCHAANVERLTAVGKHPAKDDCVSCHMPKRRTEDAVHVVMTEHRIQRLAPHRDLLAELKESHPAALEEYRGRVLPYYPKPLPPTPENALYVALAQVRDGSNLAEGLPQLTSALAHALRPNPEFYMALGDAWHSKGDPVKAAGAYRQAADLQPGSARAFRYLGIALRESGLPERAEAAVKRAIQMAPDDARSWSELGLIASDQGKTVEAYATLQKATVLDADLPDAWNGIGVNLSAIGNGSGAEIAFRRAVQLDPYFTTAIANLARLLVDRGDLAEAVYLYKKTTLLQPANAVNRYEYALALVRMDRFEDSRREAEASLSADPNLAEAHELLGGLLARIKDFDAAVIHYREAVRLKPAFGRAQLDLAATLASKGDLNGAVLHFRQAAKSPDPRIAETAARALRELGGGK